MQHARAVLVVIGIGLGVVRGAEGQVVERAQPGVASTPAESVPSAGVRTGGTPAMLTDRPEDEKALRSIAEAYVRAYNAGDARVLASLFTDDAEMIDEQGEQLQSRARIEEVFSGMFKERPGAKISVFPASLKFLGPEVAVEEGQTQVKLAGDEPPSSRHYSILYVKQGNRWRYSRAREEAVKGLSHHQRLLELEWLVGDWLDETPDSVVHTVCRWTDDQNFLLRDFTVRVQGKSVMTVHERIGWDPSTRQIKSWVFDSEGGHGSGLWSRNGSEWVIKSTGILPDGRTATATHILTRISPQSARWASVERTVGDQVVPDHAEYVMVRRPPQPGTK
jgi:uncharacterized protein (TIGR02246 family)